MSFATRVLRADVGPLLLLIFGAFVATSSAFILRSDLEVRRTWHEVEGLALGSEVFSTGGSAPRSHNTRVTFRYVIDGVTHVSTTAHQDSMEFYYATQKTLTFAPGTRHRLWYRPGDPKEIRFDLDDSTALVGSRVGIVLGLVLMAAGALAWWKPGASPRADPNAGGGD